MGASALKEKIFNLIDKSDPEVLQSVYQLLKESDYTEAFKNELKEEYSDYKKEGKIITQKEMNSLIAAEMKSNK